MRQEQSDVYWSNLAWFLPDFAEWMFQHHGPLHLEPISEMEFVGLVREYEEESR